MTKFKLNGVQYRAYKTNAGKIIVEGKDSYIWHRTGSLRVVQEAKRLMSKQIEGNTP